MKHLLLTTIAAVVLVGCGANSPEITEDIIWGQSGEGIAIENNGQTMVRRSDTDRAWCGSISKIPLPSEKKVTVKIESSSGKFYSYIGVFQKDVDLNDYRRAKFSDNSWCLYFADDKGRSGMHDSEYSKRNNKSDWRSGVVPPLHNSDTISILYSRKRATVSFFKGGKTVYVGEEYTGELYLYCAVRYPGESITIVE